MIRCALALSLIFVFAGTAYAQDSFIGSEPPTELLGAPKYPNVVFLRTIDSLDPYYQSVLYVTPDPPEDVIDFFVDRLEETKVITYQEQGSRVWAFLLAPWILLDNNPTRDELIILDSSPNIQVKPFERSLYAPLIEYYDTREGFGEQIRAMDEARTGIRYTHERSQEDGSMEEIAGSWRNIARDQDGFYGAVIEFTTDGTYRLEYTDENLQYHASRLASSGRHSGRDVKDIVNDLESRNPETGEFDILRNTITLYSPHPVFGPQTKSGLATVKSFSLTLRFVNMPVLTFIRVRD